MSNAATSSRLSSALVVEAPATGPAATDSECKCPNGGSKPRAHVGRLQGNNSEGLRVAAAASSHTRFMVNERQPMPPHPRQGASATQPTSAQLAAASGARGSADTRPMVMERGNSKFDIGQCKGKMYHEFAQNITHMAWAKQQNTPSKQSQDFLTWFDRYYVVTGGVVEVRAFLGIPEGVYQP